MSSRSSSTSTSPDAKTEATTAVAAMQWPELTRQQFARSVDLMAAAFRAGQAMQQVNLQMSERAALLHSQAAENARKATSPTELLQIQSTLAVYEWQELTRYSQELLLAYSRAVGQPTAAALGEQTANGTSAAAKAGGGLADAAIGAAGPMVQAWQQMFTPGSAQDGAQQARH